MWHGILIVLAVAGLVTILIGRIMLIREAYGMSWGWLLALRYLPFADLLFLMRYWDIARSAGVMIIVGFAMLLPFGTQIFLETHKDSPRMGGKKQPATAAPEPGSQSVSLEERYASYYGDMLSRRKLQQTAKVSELAGYAQQWHARLTVLRKSVPEGDTVAMDNFRKEAEAYKEFLEAHRREAEDLEILTRLSLSPR
jgi:hypothetical protein